MWLLLILSTWPDGSGSIEEIARYETLKECAAHVRAAEENYGAVAFCRQETKL